MTKSKHRDSDRPVEAEEPRPAEQSEPGLEAEGSRPVEERLLDIEPDDVEFEEDLTTERAFDTQRSEGHTYDPWKAEDQGLTYTPPSDPPVVPSEDDPQGAEIAAGFAPSMEDSDPDVERLPRHVDNNDLDLLDDVYEALQTNSETAHLDNVKVQVNNKVVYLLGTVETQDDVGRVHDIVNSLNGIRSIRNNLQVYP